MEGRERAIEHREKRVEEERSLMQSQVQLLQTELDARCEEVLAAKRDAGRRLAEVTQDLAERSEEAEAAARREEVVREEANQQRVRAEQLAERLREARNSEGKLEENFRAELAAQTRFEIFHFSPIAGDRMKMMLIGVDAFGNNLLHGEKMTMMI